MLVGAPLPPCSGAAQALRPTPQPPALQFPTAALRSPSARGLRRVCLPPTRALAPPGEEPSVAGFVGRKVDSGVNGCIDSSDSVPGGTILGVLHMMSTVRKSSNIVWHECPIGKPERQRSLNQKGCVIWITGLSGSGKSTFACGLSRDLHHKGHLTYVLDGDNLRHGLNQDLSFEAEDRAENVRRVGEVAKLFADAGVICIASLISPYRKERDACRSMLSDSSFIEVFMEIPIELCESRDPKGLYKLARAGKIKGFTGVDDPYEPPIQCEIVIQQKDGRCPSPKAMADQVISYLDKNGFLQA